MSRFPVVAREDMSPRQREVADAIVAGPRGALKGPFQILIHNPELASRVQALGEHLRFATKFSKPLTEIAILVVARRWTCQYEWFAHARLAREAGVRDDVIEAIGGNGVPADLSPDEALVRQFSAEASRDGQPSDAAFDAAVARFGRDGVLDLLAVCGYYTLLAMVLNAARPELPLGTTPLEPLG